MTTVKARRQRVILELVESLQVRTHDQLAAALHQRGIDASQGTLSRDLRELGIVKAADGYALGNGVDRNPQSQQDLARATAQFLVGLQAAQNIVVLHTHPGGANALARVLDAAQWPEIIGTIAGDDTIFISTRDARTAVRVRDLLAAL